MFGSLAARLPMVVDAMKLKSREIQILTLAARGNTSAAIARQLRLSKRTVDFYLNSARLKLQARTRTEAAVKAAVRGLIKL